MKRAEISLQDKVALITGAAGGLGGAIAWAFGAAGARVFLHDLFEDQLKDITSSMRAEGIEAGYKALDITAPGAPQMLVDAAISVMGKIDIAVNSAGINRPQKHEDVTEKNWDDIMNINLKAMFFVSQAAGKQMIAKGGGKIINISSQAGLVALPLRAAYCSSKGGVNQLTRTLALDWAKYNILVNAIAPSFVETALTAKMFEDESFRQYVLDSIPLGRIFGLGSVEHDYRAYPLGGWRMDHQIGSAASL